MWKGEDCLGCPIGSMSYRHSLLILCTPLPRHTPGIPRQRPNQQKTGENWGKNVPSREKKEIRGCSTNSSPGKRSCPGCSARFSSRARALPGSIQHPCEGSGGANSPPRQPHQQSGRQPPAGHCPFKLWPHLPPPRLPEGLRQQPPPPSLPPSLHPSVRPSVPPAPGERQLRAGPRSAEPPGCPCPRLGDHGMLHRALHPDFPLHFAAGKWRRFGRGEGGNGGEPGVRLPGMETGTKASPERPLPPGW